MGGAHKPLVDIAGPPGNSCQLLESQMSPMSGAVTEREALRNFFNPNSKVTGLAVRFLCVPAAAYTC